MPQASSLKPVAAVWLAIASLALVSLAGCGGSTDPFTYVKEKGKITFEDGSLIPAPRIELIFNSEAPKPKPDDPNAKFSPPQGIGEVNVADGTYDIKSHYQDGLVAGKSKVIVRCINGKERPITTLVATEYSELNTTPLEVDTAHPESFNLTVKKYSGPPGGPVPTGLHRLPPRSNGQR